ncbi:MAG TPA: leucine--tRNA ligase, partial [Bacillota bacterium]|nr:leucine--tRNA ligase [Bacillota bacterium]
MRLEKYQPGPIEEKWQQKWEEDGLYRSTVDESRPKHYALTMLPYPSGDLHIGHWYALTPSDARARFMRMKGYNVLFPMGFDAFGLPAENAAIKRGIHPHTWTMANIERMRKQLKSMGGIFDWKREIVSCLPDYYRWTQWFFLKFFERGVAYKKFAPVDFCPQCNTTLAREQVWGEDRHCERCGTPVIKKELHQWFFKITDYADELLDFSKIDWPERVTTMQENWIGRSEGAEVEFKTESGKPFTIFTTRPDTLWGVTFMVLAPEHPLVAELTTAETKETVEKYCYQASRQTEIERLATDKEKTGVFTGSYAINPVTGDKVPIWIADYVMMGYGTGAIMAVPAHDQRDFDFARKYGLEIKVVVQPDEMGAIDATSMNEAVPAHGRLVNSGPLTGTPGEESLKKAIEYVEKLGVGKAAVNYRLRDWLISRQRYWGAPIPIIYCPKCGTVPVPYEDLPVLLPEDAEFLPTGESPLKYHEGFKNTKCPHCGGPAERETDTMDTFMCSSWYQYGYLSPYYHGETPFDPKEGAYWLPVDQYTGGVEHACMHLIYTRFFTKVMRDLGLVDFDEPMVSLRNQGIILGEDSEKMSKSRGNVVAPDGLVNDYGADAVRAYLMFGWRWEQGGPWDTRGVEGIFRFLNRVWELILGEVDAPETVDAELERAVRRKVHQTIRKATNDLENFSFNTYIAAMMELSNTMAKAKPSIYGGKAWQEAREAYTLLLAPVCPHITEEIWSRIGGTYSVHNQQWPVFDPELAAEDSVEMVIQINV